MYLFIYLHFFALFTDSMLHDVSDYYKNLGAFLNYLVTTGAEVCAA